MGGGQNYGPFLGPYYNTALNYLGYPKRDHDFDNHLCALPEAKKLKLGLYPQQETTQRIHSLHTEPNRPDDNIPIVDLYRKSPYPEKGLLLGWLLSAKGSNHAWRNRCAGL